MSKIKMRCITCGKWFQSANAKEVTCPECMQKARKEKMASKSGQATPDKTTGTATPPRAVPPPPKPKPASSGSRWFDSISGIKVSEPEPPPARPKIPSSPVPRDNRPESPTGPGGYRDRDFRGPGGYREGGQRDRGPGGYREGERYGSGGFRDRGPGAAGTLGQRPRQPMEGGPRPGPRPGGPGEQRGERPFGGGQRGGRPGGKPARAKASKPPTPPKPKREKIPPPAPFKPTDEQIKQVEERYLELATPAEYDGIRTQIAHELGIPKKAVKKIVKELRDRQGIPSWWELQTYKGDAEELEKIRALYLPHLPIPDIGVHKTIADELGIKPGEAYQAIKLIRQEMGLPQYNDPVLHGIELKASKKKEASSQEPPAQEEQSGEAKGEQGELPATATGAAINLGPTETPSGQATEVPASTNDAEATTEGASEPGQEQGAVPTDESVMDLGPTHPVEPGGESGSSEAPEAVAVNKVDGNTGEAE